MIYFKYAPYLYLVAGAFFLVDAIVRLQNGENAILSFAFVGIAIFMFFFRKKFPRRYDDRNREK